MADSLPHHPNALTALTRKGSETRFRNLIEMLSGIRHIPMLEDPGTTAALLRDFAKTP
ncbi:hypothetical protein OHB26_26695 [Nocardia sp. NBC_01503]|uniref:hypothetical protein n=1 Tax=Nocardia sp. NBC_01503 TaxID=2975997 RepID=UPI002E7C4EEF|nr:hypothetical protein [Nocardia sp. NBC_01503]WTL30503.1 hypothetical protein OHB26_26695 [Nocardia sp. NBC_01503]